MTYLSSRKLPGFFPWLIWAISSAFVAFQMLIQTSPSVMIDGLEKSFAVNTFQVSILSSSFFYSYIICQIPAGMLVDRVAPRNCLAICLLMIAFLMLAFATTHTFNLLISYRVMLGFFCAPAVVATLFLCANWFPAKYFALLAGLTEMSGMLGAALGQAGLAPLINIHGWRQTNIYCAIFCFILAILTVLIVRNRSDEISSPFVKKSHILADLKLIVTYPQAWVNGIYSGIYFAICSSFASFWCIPYLRNIYNLSLTQAAFASSTILLGMAIGAPFLGWLSDKICLRRLPMIVCSFVVFFIMLVILYVALSLTTLIIALFLLGFFTSVYALPFAVMRDVVPVAVRGTAMGYTNMMCLLIGAPLLQPLIGWILHMQLHRQVEIATAYRYAFALLGISLLVGIVLAFLVKETNCGRS